MGMMRKLDASAVTLENVEPAAELLRSLASPQRLAIVCTLIEGERAVSELEATLGIRQPSLSQHLGSLREAGLIVGRREAKAVFYRVSDPRAAAVVEALHAIFCEPRLASRLARVEHARPSVAKRALPYGRSAPPSRSEAAVFAIVGENA